MSRHRGKKEGTHKSKSTSVIVPISLILSLLLSLPDNISSHIIIQEEESLEPRNEQTFLSWK
jgi:hypothetical protein